MGAFGSSPSGASSIITEVITGFDSAAVDNASSLDTTVVLPGANTTDMVVVTPQAAPAAGISFSGRVSSTNVLTIRVTNNTAATVNPAAIDLVVALIKRAPGN